VSVDSVNVARLVLREHAEDRLEVELDYPVIASGWLEPTDHPLTVSEALTANATEPRVEPGAPVSAFAVREGSVTLLLADASKTRRAACAQLALAGSVAPAAAAAPGEALALRVSTGVVSLRIFPDGDARVVARLASGVALLVDGERNGFVRVRLSGAAGNEPGAGFWISSTDFAQATQPKAD